MVLAADAAVLDWQMSSDDVSDKTRLCREIISTVFKEEKGRRPRLILVYPGESVTESLVDTLMTSLSGVGERESHSLGSVRKEEEGFGLVADKLHIVFVKKYRGDRIPGGLAPEEGGGAPEVVVEGLPECLLKEYARLTEGILPAAAFNAVATVRENTGALLSLFKKELDPAFVHHLLLIPDLRDGEFYLHELLRDGMYSLSTTDGYCRENLKTERLREWFGNTDSFLKTKLGENCSVLMEHCSEAAVSRGTPVDITPERVFTFLLEEKSSQPVKKIQKKYSNWFSAISEENMRTKAALELLEICECREESLAEFARLHAVESDGKMPGLYDQGEPHVLQNGTVIQSGEKYFLCILPACDLVRLSGNVSIPFLCLKNTPDSKAQPTLCFFHDNALQKVRFPHTKIWAEITFFHFRADSGMGQIVSENGNFKGRTAQSTEATELPWVAKLKGAVMLDLHQRIFANMSRIGDNDFEWIRRHKK